MMIKQHKRYHDDISSTRDIMMTKQHKRYHDDISSIRDIMMISAAQEIS